jgi:hypothetical protein
MERERYGELYFYRSVSSQINVLQLAKQIRSEIREREIRTRLPCRILRLVVDLAWGTWQHPTQAPKEPRSLACAREDSSLGGPLSGLARVP